MKIDSSTIQLSSSRTYTSSSTYEGRASLGVTNNSNGLLANSNGTGFSSQFYNSLGQTSSTSQLRNDDITNFRERLFESLMKFMEQVRDHLVKNITKSSNLNNRFNATISNNGSDTILNLASSSTPTTWSRKTITSYSYYESETTTFSSTGTVKTSDGRTIDFNIDMNMSREFMEEYTSITEETTAILTDPLVISLDNAPTRISDVTWNFDIDGDGTMDTISMLSKGSGFLALDKNGNGIIDDGNELFGTKSGNGFADLAEYDEDGNGWIDENDSVYSKLKIWIKDDSGADKLLDLKDANIGAIYLHSAPTQHNLNNINTNDTLAQIKRTGVYLQENGIAGTIQQIDLAKIS